MSIAFKTPSFRPGEAVPALAGAFSALAAILRTFRNRRAAHRVAALPDHLLTDIGLKRDDVHEALNVTWREDPTYRLAMTARRRHAGERRGCRRS